MQSVAESSNRTAMGAETDDCDITFIRTEDVICLECTNGDAMKRGYLAAKGFGSQLCHLVPEAKNQEPCELFRCMFKLEDAMSVHAMYTYGMKPRKEKKLTSRKILMYGHAVLLRQVSTKRLLRCLCTSPSNDKMAYDVGFTQTHQGSGHLFEFSWFTVHPSSSQRSEGEKVRAGDDVFLVSVANERFLSAELSFFQNAESESSTSKSPLNSVQASFHQCVWSLNIVSSGSAKEAAIGYVNGGDVVRFVHKYKDKGTLTVASRDCDTNVKLTVPDKSEVRFERLVDKCNIRSLWRVELFQMRFGGGFTSLGQPFRLRHIVTGKYLAVKCEGVSGEGGDAVTGDSKRKAVVCLLDSSEASRGSTAFCFSTNTGNHTKWSDYRLYVDNMGKPEIRFGDSEVVLTHIQTGRVLGCPVAERRHFASSGVRRAVMHTEVHKSFALTVTRAQEEEANAAAILQLCRGIMRNYVHKVLLSSARVFSDHLEEELLQVLSDLACYFKEPTKTNLSHEEYQQEMYTLRERQGLFKRQGALQFTLTVIMETTRHRGKKTLAVQQQLYQLLAAMIRGNHSNCREFATQRWLRVFMEQLSVPAFTHHVLEVIQCLLTDSPEVLNIISQRDIGTIVKLLHTNGRDTKVMKLLSSLCVCQGVAMRDKQRQIYRHLLGCREFLLHTTLKDRVHSVHPTLYVGARDGSAMYQKWYYEKLTSRKILMYGHAVLLRQVSTKRLLRCLCTSPSNDKMAYDVGFTQTHQGSGHLFEFSWFTVHPSSSQRSEGEKVRAGDDVFLVSVANERFLSAELSFFQNAESESSTSKSPLNSVQASFHQCVWSLNIVSSGSAKEAAIGYVNGGDVVRFVHKYKDKGTLTVASRDCDTNVKLTVPDKSEVRFERLVDKCNIRSLWRVELFQMRFGGGFTSLGQPFRLRHIVTGKYLAVKCEGVSGEGGDAVTGDSKRKAVVCLLDSSEASRGSTAFCFSTNTGNHTKWSDYRLYVDNMGKPEIKFGDSEVVLTHIQTGRVLGCPVAERRHYASSGVRRAVMHTEVHKSFALTVTRAQEEEANAAAILQLCRGIMRNYVHKVLLSSARVFSDHLEEELLQVLSDLACYFKEPTKSNLSHEEYQQEMYTLRERQGLFKRQGALQFTLTVIMETTRHRGKKTLAVQQQLYQLLAAMIRGNHSNCREFATQRWLRVFMEQLSVPAFTHHVLEVIQCLLTDSPEVLNIISQRDIGTIVKLLHTNGRDTKVMKLLSSLCVCQGVAMRDKQRQIYRHLLGCREFLLHTTLKDRVHSVHPTLYVGARDGSAMYQKWYYEVQVTQIVTKASATPPHFRVGWAHAHHFLPQPTSNGTNITDGGIGDDVFSVGFDGVKYWVGGRCIPPPLGNVHPDPQRQLTRQEDNISGSPSSSQSSSPVPHDKTISVGDVIGCYLDLERGVAWFTRNGVPAGGELVFHHSTEMLTPAVSFSAGISAAMSLGGQYGQFSHAPPIDYAPLCDTGPSSSTVRLIPFRCLGVSNALIVSGPIILADYESFLPAPIVTSGVSLPDPLLRSGIKDQLAENIHEVWAKNKVEAGFTYAEVRNDKLKHNPSLKPFKDLTDAERKYDYDMALETLSTLVALGYQISTNSQASQKLPYMELPTDTYQLSNGYTPRPLNLECVTVPRCLMGLVERLAENAHNVWAAGRIKEGWTFGKASDRDRRRNSLLVPYCKLDRTTKKSNEDTALESVRTIMALGCVILPPTDNTSSIQMLAREFADSHVRMRTFRGQTCYKLTTGKWYYEVTLLTGGMMRIGWATPTYPAGTPLGTDTHSYAFDGFLACKWHGGSDSFGQRWKAGDVVGCLLDIDEHTISFTLNGELLHEVHSDCTIAFDHVISTGGFVPAITLSAGERAQLNFGQSEEAMQYNHSASGFEPVCCPTALAYNVPLWYSSRGGYETIDHTHPTLLTQRKSLAEGKYDSIISISSRNWDYSALPKQECLRLNVGVTFTQATPTVEPDQSDAGISFGRNVSVNECVGERVCYSVIVPSGQDPSQVFVGWTTPEFRYVETQFQTPGSDSVPSERRYGQQIDMTGPSLQGASYSTAFMVCLAEVFQSDDLHLSHSVTLVCIIDLTLGKVIFNITTSEGVNISTNEREFPVAQDTKLFPTMVITSTSEQFVDFNFNPVQGCSSLTSLLFAPFLEASLDLDTTFTPVCPPRFKIQAYLKSRWVRQSLYKANYSVGVTSTGQLKLSADRERSFSVLVNLPEEERAMDILELSEHHELLDFHIQTLETFCAVCSHSNLELAEKISKCLDSATILRYMRVAEEGMKYNLKSAYLKLFFAVHLRHEVLTRLAMRGEFVIPLSECSRSVPLFPLAPPPRQTEYSLNKAPLPGTAMHNQELIGHNISSSFSRLPFKGEGCDGFSVNDFKDQVFESLENLLTTRSYSVKLLPATLSEIFVPLVNALDYLLVIGVIQMNSDLQRLLHVLDPQLFTLSNGKKICVQGLLSPEVSCEEPIKSALCDLLQHLCDCQVQHRVESVVTFANGYVDELQEEQKSRHKKYFKKRPREFRCPPEMQLQAMLTVKSSTRNSPTQSKLYETISSFHKQLQGHCGSAGDSSQIRDSLSTAQKLEQLVTLLNSSDDPCIHGDGEDRGTSLRDLIVKTMIKWAESEVQDLNLIGQIFSLLHRQFNEIHEVAESLKHTYVIDIAEEEGKVNYDVAEFSRALGSLRLLLKVGMGKMEESLMKASLSTIQNSRLFFCHPHLLRQLGVHATVLGLIRTYLGISSGSADQNLLSSRRMRRLNMSRGGSAPPPVEDCCRFLCTFARISQENQRVLFGHIGYLLEHVEKYPELTASSGFTPLDVATATIRDNQELALALEESHLENVVQLLVTMTTSPCAGSQDLSDSHRGNDLGMIHSVSFSFNFEWNPRAGGKCLEFLQCAVWVDNEQIQENAYSIVRLLIRHSECMGPALAGEALGLYKVYKEAIDKLEPELGSFAESSGGFSRFNESFASRSSSSSSFGNLVNLSRQSSILNPNTVSTKSVLTFYTCLVRLLACCAPSKNYHAHISDHAHSTASKQREGSNARTQNILRNLVKLEDIVAILTLPCMPETQQGLGPAHKKAIVWFLERVYDTIDPEVFIKLLADGFLPDLKLTLKTVETDSDRCFIYSLKRYVCCSILPLVTRHSTILKRLLTHLHVLDSFVMCCCQLYTSDHLSSTQLEHIANFLVAFTRELHPRAIQRFMPKIISNLHSTQLSSTVHCKFLSSHYERYARYYQSGVLDKTTLGTAEEGEKTSAALVVHRLLDSLSEKLPSDPIILRSAISCIKFTSCALSPDCLVPAKDILNSLYSTSADTYEPRPLNTSRVSLTADLQTFISSYASYCHDNWIFEKQSDGWAYGPIRSKEKNQDPNIRPFETLDESDQLSLKAQAEAAVKFLLMVGMSLIKRSKLDTHNIPFKQKTVCIRRHKRKKGSEGNGRSQWEERPYEPEVLELSRVELRIELLALAETLAEDSHERWARELKCSSPDCHAHPSFVPYVLLDEKKKEELRTYALDLMRYLKVSGFETSRTYRSMSVVMSSSGGDQRSCKEKFCLQLFDKFLNLLSPSTIDVSFHTQILFPTLTSYLSHHAGYFMPPAGGHRGHSFASKLEKLKILQMFCRVMEFTRQNLNKLILPVTKPSASFLCPTPEDQSGGVALSNSDSNWITVRCILSLVNSLIKALDIKGIAEDSEGLANECPEVVDFFRQAVSGIHLTTKSLAKLDKMDARFHFYCLHLLTPSLSSLFKHLGCHGSGRYLIVDSIQNHCRYIFQNLIEMATCTGPVYVGSSPLITIGECMGSFSLAYPDPFLENGMFGFSLPSLLDQLHRATVQGVTCGNVLFVVDIIVPVLTNYIARWWNNTDNVGQNSVTMETVDEVVGAILLLIAGHFAERDVTWFPRMLDGALLLGNKCSLLLLHLHLVGLMEELRERAIALWQSEQYLSASWANPLAEEEGRSGHAPSHAEDYRLFVRDLCTVLPFLTIFLHTHSSSLRLPHTPSCLHTSTPSRSHTSTPLHSHTSTPGTATSIHNIFVSVADIFHCWSSSQQFKREFQTATFTIADQSHLFSLWRHFARPAQSSGKQQSQSEKPPNLLLVCLELLLPVSDQGLSKEDRALVEICREKLGKKRVIAEDLKDEITQELKIRSSKGQPLARQLVRKFSQKLMIISPEKSVEERALKIISLARVKFKLQQVERGHVAQSRWKQVFSQRKRKAIVKCFLAVPYFKLNKHRAINMFLQLYCSEWLVTSEQGMHDRLTEELLDRQDYLALQRSQGQVKGAHSDEGDHKDPLSQLFTMFKRVAYAQESIDVPLYTAYTDILSKSVVGHSEEDEMTGDDNATKAFQLYSEHKAELIVKQGQLADRGAHSMILLVITAAEGPQCPLVHSTLKLGIALLKEGNRRVQDDMLQELRGMDVGFLSSIAMLMASCSVLDWNAYERFNKSEPAQTMTTTNDAVCKVLPRASFTVSLFRFLQLLCEGHNEAFQDYLRTQAGNTTTVNIIICTVDYLLRLQESISDFYWHYSDFPVIDLQGRENFLKAFKVAKQVVRTLTEYIQGPCIKNQETLAQSRLWDAVSGFLHVFSVLQRKLYRETSQVELLRELLGLQEEVFILLLSMLEGSAMSSSIGKLMLDMMMESGQYIQDIGQFFSIFVKLKDTTTSKAFREYDLNKDGFISYREFERAMKAQQKYTTEEIAYLMECADLNKDGLLDYLEFTERFHQPAKSIGFHLCVLVVHLCDLLPTDKRLCAFRLSTQIRELMGHFKNNMGCIEIYGKSRKIERVYFEVQQSRLQQWKEPQIQESRRNFLHSVEMGSQKDKLKGFVSFCEDTIFEMDHVDKISDSEQREMESRASTHRKTHNTMLQAHSHAFLSRVKAQVSAMQRDHSWITRLFTYLCAVWLLIFRVWPHCKAAAYKIKRKVKGGYIAVRRKLMPSPPSINVQKRDTPPVPKDKKANRPAKLILPLPQVKGHSDGKQTRRASTTVTEQPVSSHTVTSSKVGGASPTRRSTIHDPSGSTLNECEDNSLQREYKRGVSQDSHRGSLIMTPHPSKMRTLILSYDRSKMKHLSQSSESPVDADPMEKGTQSSESYIPQIRLSVRSWSALLARNYYRLNNAKLVGTFFINIILLTFKVASFDPSYSPIVTPPVDGNHSNITSYELQNPFWGPMLLEALALFHFTVSAILVASYWYLKVPLIIFKREKRIARQLEMKQLWVTEEPETLEDRWDGIVVRSSSFPRNYFDKQVKRRVCEQLGACKVKERAKRLGMETRSRFEPRSKFDQVMEICHSLFDVRYNIWAFGVTVSNVMILYQLLYCALSFCGLRWNAFYFSLHLIDLVMNFKLLRTVLRSVLHNGKQLAMTVLMTCVVIYIYTVIAFNFFRKFYHQTTPDGLQVQTCDSMFRCFIYHIDQGLRSGGGIADVLEPASGDPNEFLRLFFDITFFFFVIIILLAIIQGLIIDSFGELRDKEETLTNEMATKCFVCGLPKSKFDRIPHGFDNHINKEHNMSHYMFFLLYLIKKKESEFSGQESYVWEMYLKQDWDFFPVGDSFNSQEEYPLSGGQQGPPRGNDRQGGKLETGQSVLSTRTSVKRAHTANL